jgi:hypothetical protein
MSTRARQTRPRVASRRRLAWVLALALLLPFAQALGWAHSLSHVGAQKAHAGIALDASSCAACLNATPLQAGALPTASPTAATPPLRHAPPVAQREPAQRRHTNLAYRSRAPPPVA